MGVPGSKERKKRDSLNRLTLWSSMAVPTGIEPVSSP
jgi:hypothetical protein